MIRKLPIYFLIDNSESMLSAANADAIKNGLSLCINQLKGEPIALETVYLSLITYSEFAVQHNRLTELIKFNIPPLAPNGKNKSFGAALQLLSHSIDKEVTQPINGEKGDWMPIVIVWTDNEPTDNWEEGLVEIKKKHVEIVICIAGHDLDISIFKKVTSKIFFLSAFSVSDLKGLFNWETILGEGSLKIHSLDSTIKKEPIEVVLPSPSSIYPVVTNDSLPEKNSYQWRVRRQPIFILADVSLKEHLDLINNGIKVIIDALRCEPQMLETAYISLVTFGYASIQEGPLTDLCSFKIPDISERMDFKMALKVLCQRIDAEVRKPCDDRKEDRLPFVFILINGDSIQNMVGFKIDDLKKRNVKLVFFVHELSKSSRSILGDLFSEIGRAPLINKLDKITKNDIACFFDWYSLN